MIAGMRPTFHLLPREVWLDHDPRAAYVAPSLVSDGFIHCTDGAAELVATANRYFRDDPREFVALLIDLDAAGSPWRTDDPSGIYPHVYGPIDPEAILEVRPVRRGPDGRFIDWTGTGSGAPVTKRTRDDRGSGRVRSCPTDPRRTPSPRARSR